jgi:hypothetical protein
MIRASVAPRFETVTTVSHYGAIGLGHLIDGHVCESGGNGFYYPASGLKTYHRDDGEEYRKAVRRLNLPPAYRC